MTLRGYGLNIEQALCYNIEQALCYESGTYTIEGWVWNCVRTAKRRENGYGRDQGYKSFRGHGLFV